MHPFLLYAESYFNLKTYVNLHKLIVLLKRTYSQQAEPGLVPEIAIPKKKQSTKNFSENYQYLQAKVQLSLMYNYNFDTEQGRMPTGSKSTIILFYKACKYTCQSPTSRKREKV